jgi:hypothetical protein
MKRAALTGQLIIATGALMASLALAQAPAGSTGECKDGSYTTAESKRGACNHHGGVKDWYGADKSAEKKSSKETKADMAAPAPAAPAPAAPPPAASASKTQSKAMPQGMRAEAAPGGGAGKVWVNTSSHVYHCMGDEWYGKTKQGEYMTEADAKTKGARASHGKACS